MMSIINGFEKRAAARSELIGSAIGGPFSAFSGPAGILMGPYTERERKEVNQRDLSNLIPGVGAYRYGRRLAGMGMSKEERPTD